MKLYVVGTLCLAITACMSGMPIPMPLPKGPPKTASEVMKADALKAYEGAGVIFVTRDKTVWDKGCTYEISMDGQTVAGLRNGEQVALYADPGGRAVGVSIRKEGSCHPAAALVPVNVVANATTKIRIVKDSSYDLHLEATTY